MKTHLQHTNPKSQDFDEIEKMVKTGHVKGSALAEHDGATDKETGKSKIIGITLEILTGSIYACYNSMLSAINSFLDCNLQIQQGTVLKIKIETENRNLVIKQNKAKQEYKLLEYLVPDKSVKQILITFALNVLILVCILGTECILMIRSLQLICQTLLFSLVAGIGITVSIATIGYLGSQWINENIKSAKMRKLARIALCLIILIAFVGLAMLRDDFLKKTQNNSLPIWVFVGLNIFLFLVIYFITDQWMIPLVNKARDAFKALRAKKKADKKLEEIDEFDRQIAQNKFHLDQFLSEKMTIIRKQINAESEVETNYQQSIADYKQSAMCVYDDGTLPPWLKEEPKKLNFFTTDIFKETTHENA